MAMLVWSGVSELPCQPQPTSTKVFVVCVCVVECDLGLLVM